jgi:hypothetical protein
MGKIDKYAAFVKEQIGVQQKLALKYEDSPFRKGQHLESAKNLSDLSDFLGEIQKRGTGDTSYLYRGDSPLKRLHLTYEDIKDLTDEQLRELNLTDPDRQDLIVEHMIAQNGGYYSLDKIMVDLFRETKKFPQRKEIISRLYRMVAKGMIYNVPGKKGVYSTYEMTELEAKKLFGTDGETEEPTPTAESAPAQPAQPAKPTTVAPKTFKSRFGDSAGMIRRPLI